MGDEKFIIYKKEEENTTREEQTFEKDIEEKPKCYGIRCMTCDCYELCQ